MDMIKILVTDGIEKSAALALEESGFQVAEKSCQPEELKKEIQTCDAIIVRSATKVTREVIDAAMKTGRLSLIVRGGVGVDNIDVAYAREMGITVKNTPCASSLAVAELTIGHMFALARKMYIANMTMKNGLWDKKKLTGIELAGKTLGLIGFGHIAQEVARLARLIGMTVIYHTRSGKKDGFDQYEYVPMDELLKRSDFISLHIPLDKKTGPTIAEKEFAMMKKGVYLVNCARGGVVSEAALLEALDSGQVAAAAVDVFEQEPTHNDRLIAHERVCLSPHIGASTAEAQERIGTEIVSIIQEFFEAEQAGQSRSAM
jgi:D-3-phosphoglycerate dehydrogenase